MSTPDKSTPDTKSTPDAKSPAADSSDAKSSPDAKEAETPSSIANLAFTYGYLINIAQLVKLSKTLPNGDDDENDITSVLRDGYSDYCEAKNIDVKKHMTSDELYAKIDSVVDRYEKAMAAKTELTADDKEFLDTLDSAIWSNSVDHSAIWSPITISLKDTSGDDVSYSVMPASEGAVWSKEETEEYCYVVGFIVSTSLVPSGSRDPNTDTFKMFSTNFVSAAHFLISSADTLPYPKAFAPLEGELKDIIKSDDKKDFVYTQLDTSIFA